MTDFYKQRKEAINDIDKLLVEEKPKEAIIFYVAAKYGFSEKIVLERMKQREELSNVSK